MALIPPFLIVFDSTALLAGNARDWQDISRLGECFVPMPVLKELRSLCDRAPDPETEAKAREFARFYPNSAWKQANELVEHSSLNPVAGHSLSKRARLSLEVLESAYGLARRHPEALVVLIANDQPMLQRLTPLKTNNLCGIPFTALLQWHRTQRKPESVSKHLQLMRSLTNAVPSSTVSTRSTATPNHLLSNPSRSPARSGVKRENTSREIAGSTTSLYTAHRTASRATSSRTANSNNSRISNSRISDRATTSIARPVQSYRRSPSLDLSKLIINLIGWIALAIVVLTIWRFISPASFNQLWQQLPLPGFVFNLHD
jgi:hypothetical protein